MCALQAVLGLLLLGTLQAFPQGQAPTDICAGDTSLFYDEAARRCCYRCPVGLSPQQRCPQRSSDCRKQCEPDHYLGRDNRCTACVSCGDGLVEKKPCSWNSPRICECRAGMFCATTATNSCARCSPHSSCPIGTVVKFLGTAERDTVCEPPSPGTSPDCSTNPEDCKVPSSGTAPRAKPILASTSSDARATHLGGGIPLTLKEDSKLTRTPNSLSSGGKPSPDPGLSQQRLCPPGSSDCRKQCEQDYYLDRDGRCTACVSCGDDLVEKTPCTWNSSRVCGCRPGMFCATSAINSCARCVAFPIVSPEVVTELQGTAERGASYEPPSRGTHLNCSTNPEGSEASDSTSSSQISPEDSQASKGHGGGATHALGDASISTSAPLSFSSTGRPVLVSGPVLLWVIVLLVVFFVSGSFLLCHRKACWKWIQQKLHLCRPVQTFQPKQEPVDSRPQRNQTELTRNVSMPKPCTDNLGLTGLPSVPETCLQSQPLLGASPHGSPSSPRDLSEPWVTPEHTNNRIEKIYIMKADTVIVGTVKTEVPEGRGPMGPAGLELKEGLEMDHAPHYPEQETEPPLGSCADLVFSVEEEGKEDKKEDSLPTTASGK